MVEVVRLLLHDGATASLTAGTESAINSRDIPQYARRHEL